jgi:hypothetical protein
MTKTSLLRSAAFGAVLAVGVGAHAQAADKADCSANCKPIHHHHHKMAPKPVVESPLVGEVAALKAEVAALEQRLDASAASVQSAQAAAAAAQASAQAAQASAHNDELAINQIPGDVNTAVAALPKPKTDALYIKGVKVTLGGFVAAEAVYRTRGMGSDFSIPLSGLPYAGTSTKSAHTGEFRETARQSRISGLVEGDVTPDIHLSGYGEFDFLGAAQTANSNESNSYNLRIRHIYTTVDWKSSGLSLLAGQTWSLATLNDNGITPRKEVTPLTIDAQYVPGFVWARQPQVRLTENFGNGFWAALSVETPQTNKVDGTAAFNPGVSVAFNQASLGGSLFNSANSYSFNQLPDVIGKVAFDQKVGGHHVHLEAFGLYRDFYDRVQTSSSSFHNDNTSGGGGGFGVIGQIVPGLLDGQVSGLYGKGLGRYGSAQMSDTYAKADGSLDGITQGMLLAGLTVHATPALDIYGYVGGEQAEKSTYKTGSANGGYGNPNFSNLGGCESSTVLACNGNTKSVEQATLGFWDKVYTGPFGQFRVGAQYSYSKRDSFSGIVNNTGPLYGSVKGDDNMLYTSIRYYPF